MVRVLLGSSVGMALLVTGWILLKGSDAPVPAAGIAPPSGQPISFLETINAAPGTEGLATRFRFVAPRIAREGGSIDAETAQADMEWLCNNFALSRLPTTGPVPSQIIISLADRELVFGEPAPEATQFFEAYAVEDGRCVWEPF